MSFGFSLLLPWGPLAYVKEITEGNSGSEEHPSMI